MTYENRTKVIQHLIDNNTRYKWRFDIHTNSFEMFVDDTQFILKNYAHAEECVYKYDIVFVVKDKKRYLLVRIDVEPLLRDLWIKVYTSNVSTKRDSDWKNVYDELLEPKIKL